MGLNGFKMAKKVQATCFKWAQMGSNGFKMVKQFKWKWHMIQGGFGFQWKFFKTNLKDSQYLRHEKPTGSIALSQSPVSFWWYFQVHIHVVYPIYIHIMKKWNVIVWIFWWITKNTAIPNFQKGSVVWFYNRTSGFVRFIFKSLEQWPWLLNTSTPVVDPTSIALSTFFGSATVLGRAAPCKEILRSDVFSLSTMTGQHSIAEVFYWGGSTHCSTAKPSRIS